MNRNFILSTIVCLLLVSCTTKKSFYEVRVDNPAFIPDSAFSGYEDLSNPKFATLKEKYQLDTLFHGEKNELKRIQLIRGWVNRHIKIDNDGLTSVTPNFKTYQVKVLPKGDWTAVSDNIQLKLTKDKNEFIFRSVNLAGVTGPEHKIFIQAK